MRKIADPEKHCIYFPFYFTSPGFRKLFGDPPTKR
jgi:hypothetical protein